MNSIHDIRYPYYRHAKKRPDICERGPRLEVIWERWNMLLKYGAENRIIKEVGE